MCCKEGSSHHSRRASCCQGQLGQAVVAAEGRTETHGEDLQAAQEPQRLPGCLVLPGLVLARRPGSGFERMYVPQTFQGSEQVSAGCWTYRVLEIILLSPLSR